MVTAPLPEALGSATLTALTVTVLGDGTGEGAVYRPVPLMVPVVCVPPVTPFTFQTTELLVEF